MTKLSVVVRAAIAKAIAAINHATVEATSVEQTAKVISQTLASEIAENYFELAAYAQEIAGVAYSQVLAITARLDEHNLWGIRYGEEFNWDYLTFEDDVTTSVTVAVADLLHVAEDYPAQVIVAPVSDLYLSSDAYSADIHIYSEDGTVGTYFAGDYSTEDFNAAENSHQDAWGSVFETSRSDSSETTDVAASSQTVPAADVLGVTDATTVDITAVVVDTRTTTDVVVSNQTSVRSDTSTTSDITVTHIQLSFVEGVTRTYFAGDYAAEDYNAAENSHQDAFDIALSVPVSDSYSSAPSTPTASLVVAALDTVTISETRASDQTSARADALATSDTLYSLWVLPAWADAAVPIDSIAITLSVTAQDSSTCTDSTSAVIQNYAIDPTYFAGDYATTVY